MTTATITLRGEIQYHERFPPKDAKKGYVARITGRAKGALKYEREFLGSEFQAVDADDAGLYEVQTGLKKGGFSRSYYVILHSEHGMVRSLTLTDEVVIRIAKLIDDRVPITDAVEITDLRIPEGSTQWRFLATPRTKAAAQKAAAALKTEDAAATIRAAIAHLAPPEAAKLLRALAKEITTPAPAAPEAPAPTDAQPAESA